MQRIRIVRYVSCLNSSLLECRPAVQEVGGSNTGQDMSVSGARVEDGGNRKQRGSQRNSVAISSVNVSSPICLHINRIGRTTSRQRSIF
jgi:hypothetical protein